MKRLILTRWTAAAAVCLPVVVFARPSSDQPAILVAPAFVASCSISCLPSIDSNAPGPADARKGRLALGSGTSSPQCKEKSALTSRMSTPAAGHALMVEMEGDDGCVPGGVLNMGDTSVQIVDSSDGRRTEDGDYGSSTNGMRSRRRRQFVRKVPPALLAATTGFPLASVAAVTGGRIGGGGYSVPSRGPSAPPTQQQQQRYEAASPEYRPPRAGRDIYGSDGSRVHIQFGNGGGRRGYRSSRLNSNVGDVTSTAVTPVDVAMVGAVGAGVMALQRYNRKRFLEEEQGSAQPGQGGGSGGRGGGKEASVVTTLQFSVYCDRRGGAGDLLSTLDSLSQTAEVNTSRGLSALVVEVCLALLRSETAWIGGTGGIKEYPPKGAAMQRKEGNPVSRAKRDFNRAVTRERSKWERETVSNTPDRGFSSSTAPGWKRSRGTAEGTYAVATLMVAWSSLRSTPPQPEKRKGGMFWQSGGNDDDDDAGFAVVDRKSALALLEWVGDEAAEGQGENVVDVEVLWTPADPDDFLDRDDLATKWPELRVL